MGIAFTTINDCGGLLRRFLDHFTLYNRLDDVKFYIVGDYKTPHFEEAVQGVNDGGLRCEYYSVEHQKAWLKDYPALAEMIPWNSGNRRNLGYLLAVEDGCEVVVSLDDDNYPGLDDFYAGHSKVGAMSQMRVIECSSRWFNPCSLLSFTCGRPYSRGFPLGKRVDDVQGEESRDVKAAVNMGLWTKDPDVDAVVNLCQRTRSLGYRFGMDFALGQDSFTVLNTQNTSFNRDILPCYYVLPTQFLRVNNYTASRYDDIWHGFLVQACIKAVGEAVTVGAPIAVHDRNKHDFVSDLRHEWLGMQFNDAVASFVEELDYTAKDYFDAYESLRRRLLKHDFGSTLVNRFFNKVAENMKTWTRVCEKVM